MDKSEFLEVAPSYYALAIISIILDNHLVHTKDEIIEKYSSYDPDDPENPFCLVSDGKLLDRSLLLLESQEIIRIELDHFGPPLIIPHTNFETRFDRLCDEGNAIYDRFRSIGSTRDQ